MNYGVVSNIERCYASTEPTYSRLTQDTHKIHFKVCDSCFVMTSLLIHKSWGEIIHHRTKHKQAIAPQTLWKSSALLNLNPKCLFTGQGGQMFCMLARFPADDRVSSLKEQTLANEENRNQQLSYSENIHANQSNTHHFHSSSRVTVWS